MAKGKPQKADTAKKSSPPKSEGKTYRCRSSHDEPRDGKGFIKYIAGETRVFTKDPGPNWRPVDKIREE